VSVGEGASKDIVIEWLLCDGGRSCRWIWKAEVEECSRVSKAFPTSDVCFRCAMGVGHGDSQYIYIIRVSKAPHGDVCFRYAMEGGHGGLMVRKGPAAGSNVSTTAAVRWSGRHEALSSHIGVFAVLVVVSASFSS